MLRALNPWKRRLSSVSFFELLKPALDAMKFMPELQAKGNRKLKMTFEDQLRALVFFHLQERTSAQHLLQTLKEDDFAREHVAPEDGIEKSSFSEATNTRGLDQFMHVFQHLQIQASNLLPKAHAELGDLVGIDGSLIDGTLSMLWADYRKGSKKAKVHVGFDLNRSIPRKVHLTDGNGAERPFLSPRSSQMGKPAFWTADTSATSCLISGSKTISYLSAGSKPVPKRRSFPKIRFLPTALSFSMPWCFWERLV